MTRTTLLRLALLSISAPVALSFVACGGGSDDAKILNKIKLELEDCKKVKDKTYEVKIKGLEPYPILTRHCSTEPSKPNLKDKLNATVNVGPYVFSLRKNTGDGRWSIYKLAWPALDDARAAIDVPTLAASDIDKGISLFAQAAKDDPKLHEPYVEGLKLHLKKRKRQNKLKEKDRSSLGPVQAPLDGMIAKAKEIKDPILEAKLHLEVLRYFNNFRTVAVENSVPNQNATDADETAIKAVQNDADDAKKKGDEKLYEAKMKEIETRKKELEANIKQREKDAKEMADLAKALEKRQCDYVKIALAVQGDPDTMKSINGLKAQAKCP